MRRNLVKGEPIKELKFYNLINISFVFCLLISNIAEVKIMDVFGYAQVGAGTLFFPLLYVMNDILTEVYGFSASRKTIWLALGFNLLFTLLMQLILALPEGSDWQEKQAFETVFTLSPRIVVASISSYFIGELLNSAIVAWLKFQFKGRIFVIRALFSTLIASFIESAMFGYIAFNNRIPDEELIKMVCMLTIMKVLYELLVMPFTVMLVSYLKKAEGLDIYEKPSIKGILPNWGLLRIK